MTEVDINQKLQHPRRSLGNRHGSQAVKFLKISENSENLNWAEQSAKQAVLYDFTNPENWIILTKIKIIKGDIEGIRAVLIELFTILGRDPELLSQIVNSSFKTARIPSISPLIILILVRIIQFSGFVKS